MIQVWYEALREAIGDDRLTYVLVQHCVPALTFLALCAVFTVIDAKNWWRHRRIDPRPTDWALHRRGLVEAVVGNVVLSPLLLYFALYDVDVAITPGKVGGPLPSLPTALGQLLAAFVIEDALMYWSHRALHHPALYRRFHKKHHEFHVTTVAASTYASGVEAIFSHALSGLMATWLTGMHTVMHCIYGLILVLDTVDGHCNYAVPLSPFTSGARHNFHHSHNVGTFGLKFPFWDWLCGTDAAFRRHQARQPKALSGDQQSVSG